MRFCFSPTPDTSDGGGLSPTSAKFQRNSDGVFLLLGSRKSPVGFRRRLQPGTEERPMGFCCRLQPQSRRKLFLEALLQDAARLRRTSDVALSRTSAQLRRTSAAVPLRGRPLPTEFSGSHSHAPELNLSFHTGEERTTGRSVRDARSSLRFLRCLPMASNGAAPCPPLPAFPLAPAPAPPPRGCEPSSALLLLFFSPPLPRRTRGRGTHHYPLPARTLRGRALNGALRLIYGESPVYSRPQGGS